MRNIVSSFVFLTTLATLLPADSRYVLRASFPDGTGLEIYTETTGSSHIDLGGAMGTGRGDGSHDNLVKRFVVDRSNNVLFLYSVEVSRGANPYSVMIRILPTGGAPDRHIPTVAAMREFPAVKIGEAVTLDILANPSTGEKIYDVLCPIRIDPPYPRTSVISASGRQTISLNDISLRVDGRTVSAPASFIIGSAVRIDIPGHGTYILAAADPHQPQFSATARADGKTLSWSLGPERVEISSHTNVLAKSLNGTLWLYHDPHFQPNVVGLQAADTVEWLLPKK